MAKKFLLTLVAFSLFIAFFSWVTLEYGVYPKAIRIIKPTAFKNNQQIGAVVYRRFFKEVQTLPLIVLDANSEVDSEFGVWSGFLKTARHYKNRWDKVYIDVGLLNRGTSFKKYFDKIQPINWKEIFKSLNNKKRVLVIVDSQQTSFTDNSFTKLMESLKQKKMIVGLQRFVLSASDERHIECEKEQLQTKVGFLSSPGCAALKLSRRYYRKKYDPQKKMGAMNRYPKDYYYLFIAN